MALELVQGPCTTSGFPSMFVGHPEVAILSHIIGRYLVNYDPYYKFDEIALSSNRNKLLLNISVC